MTVNATNIAEVEMASYDFSKYIRGRYIPHIWCPGCGNGIVLKSLIRAIASSGLDLEKVCLVSGIGCSSRTTGYMDFNTLHTTHGRALAFATGLKFARPELPVLVVSGDGDALAIGGNHFIHSCRRNIDLTLVLFNNHIYGMTGGQFSPTTPRKSFASTSPFGNIEPAFDICQLAIGAGATYVARGTTYHALALDKLILGGIHNKGFSIIEVVTQCPVYYGRKNNQKSPAAALMWQRDHAVAVDRFRKMTPEEQEGKFAIGVLHNQPRPEYNEEYQKLVDRVSGRAS